MKEQGGASVIGHESETDEIITSEEHREQIFDQAPPPQIPVIAQGLPIEMPVHLPHFTQPQHPNDAIPLSFSLWVVYAVNPYIIKRDYFDISR